MESVWGPAGITAVCLAPASCCCLFPLIMVALFVFLQAQGRGRGRRESVPRPPFPATLFLPRPRPLTLHAGTWMRVLWCDHCGSSCLQWPHHGVYFVVATALLGRECVVLPFSPLFSLYLQRRREKLRMTRRMARRYTHKLLLAKQVMKLDNWE